MVSEEEVPTSHPGLKEEEEEDEKKEKWILTLARYGADTRFINVQPQLERIRPGTFPLVFGPDINPNTFFGGDPAPETAKALTLHILRTTPTGLARPMQMILPELHAKFDVPLYLSPRAMLVYQLDQASTNNLAVHMAHMAGAALAATLTARAFGYPQFICGCEEFGRFFDEPYFRSSSLHVKLIPTTNSMKTINRRDGKVVDCVRRPLGPRGTLASLTAHLYSESDVLVVRNAFPGAMPDNARDEEFISAFLATLRPSQKLCQDYIEKIEDLKTAFVVVCVDHVEQNELERMSVAILAAVRSHPNSGDVLIIGSSSPAAAQTLIGYLVRSSSSSSSSLRWRTLDDCGLETIKNAGERMVIERALALRSALFVTFSDSLLGLLVVLERRPRRLTNRVLPGLRGAHPELAPFFQGAAPTEAPIPPTFPIPIPIPTTTTTIKSGANKANDNGLGELKASCPSKKIPLLSVLILSVPERLKTGLSSLMEELSRQCAGRDDVEILALCDNKFHSIGTKRNKLHSLATGSFVCFVDDDDWIEPDYIASLTEALIANPDSDCVVFDVWVSGYHETIGKGRASGSLCRYGREFTHRDMADGTFERRPNHLMVFRTEIARSEPFEDISSAEDDRWAARLCSRITRQYRIPKILYRYAFNANTSLAAWVVSLRRRQEIATSAAAAAISSSSSSSSSSAITRPAVALLPPASDDMVPLPRALDPHPAAPAAAIPLQPSPSAVATPPPAS